MSNDPNQFYQDRQRQNREENARNAKNTMETYQIEKQNAVLPQWQQRIVQVLAAIGGFAVAYLILDILF